ncbi:MAG: glycine--tRNA ligase subunit alpha, partial [Streptococcus thermophilus]|nr:glycine--tRNA ligase subunit alpha [Streptococcus thermophilus]
GLIVSFRKPFTMRENVRNTFRLFSNEKQNFDQLIPREYEEVKREFIECSTLYKQSEADLSDNPNDLKTMIAQVSAYQKLEKSYKALRSYDQYEEDFEEFSEVVEQLPQYQGKTENIKTKIKEMIEDEEHPEEDFEKLLQEIAFSSQLNATHKDVVDSFYINQLLKAIQLNEAGAVEKFEKEAGRALELGLVHPAYDYVLKCSHTFNLLDARGAVSVTERAGYIARIRNLARVVAKTFVAERKKLGYPLLDEATRKKLLAEEEE